MEDEILENELEEELEENIEAGDEVEEIDLDDPEAQPRSEGEEEENEEFEDFEYDENGDIVIPDEDGAGDGDGDSAEEGGEAGEKGASAPADPAPAAVAESDEMQVLRAQLAAYERQTKDTLAKMGVKETDPLKGLAKLAAEAEGVPEEEYLKKQREAAELEAARRRIQREKFESRMQRDLAEIHAKYPETKTYKSPEDFPNFKRFGELMDGGATPCEAYVASHPDARAAAVASATKQQSLNDTKKHLRSNVPTGTNARSVTMPRATLLEWRELFPDKSDKEIVALYKETF